MIELEDTKFYTLLNYFYSNFFVDYLERAFHDEDVSVVTLFHGMEFFLELVREKGIEFPCQSIEEYITRTYEGGDVLYSQLLQRYNEEIKNYYNKEKTFEQIYGNCDFV